MMKPNLNEQFDSNILTLFRNGITWCYTVPIIVTLTAIDLIYSKFSQRCNTPCLGITTTPPAFIKKLPEFHPPTRPHTPLIPIMKSSENPYPPESIKHFRVRFRYLIFFAGTRLCWIYKTNLQKLLNWLASLSWLFKNITKHYNHHCEKLIIS